MGADKSDVHNAVRIVDPDNDSILVAGYIEHGPAIPKDAGTTDISLDVGWLRPVCLSNLPKPGHQRLTGIGYALASIEKRLDCAECYNPHNAILP
jgi:hypothetical protein